MINWVGFGLAIFTVAVITTIIFTNHKIRFITNNYFFWLGLAGFVFVWVLGARFIPDWVDFWRHLDCFKRAAEQEQSEYISRAFLLDACPCFFCLMMLSLIIDPSRRVARLFAPIALIGGITALGTIITNGNIADENAVLSLRYLFLGLGRERCFFFMHWFQVVIATSVLLNTPRSGWRVWITSVGAFAIYLCYVGIIMAATGCCWYCTGLAINDYSPTGQYHIVVDVTKLPRELWWACPLILLPVLIATGVLVGGVCHDYVFTSKWIWKYGNAVSNDKHKYWNYDRFGKVNSCWW